MTIAFVGEMILAVIAAIIVAVLIWLYRKAGERGRASGDWKSAFTSDGTVHSEEVSSNQLFHFVWGSSTVSWGHPQQGLVLPSRRYRFVGLFKKEILKALYWCKESHITDSGAFVMQYDGNGERMAGKYIGLEGGLPLRVESVDPYSWEKLPKSRR